MMQWLIRLRACLLCSSRPQRRSASSSAGPREKAGQSSDTRRSAAQDRQTDGKVYVLTVLTSRDLAKTMTELRARYFPPERNKLDAHLTIFHALPSAHMKLVTKTIEDLTVRRSPFRIVTAPAQRRSKAILFPLSAGATDICALRTRMLDAWEPFLSAQDRQRSKSAEGKGWMPHWTVMNKEPDVDKVRAAYDEIESSFGGAEGTAEGLTLWEYLPDGHWKYYREWMFERKEQAARL